MEPLIPIYDNFTIVIRKNDTGEIREVKSTLSWYSHSEWYWTKGNAACDCNRYDIFWKETDGPFDEDPPCGFERYTVIKVIFPDGTEKELEKV